jgi:hypothetical protein
MKLIEEWRVYHKVHHPLLTFIEGSKYGYLNTVAKRMLPSPCYYKVSIENGMINLSFSPFSKKGYSIFKGRIVTQEIFLQKNEYLLLGNWRKPKVINIKKTAFIRTV